MSTASLPCVYKVSKWMFPMCLHGACRPSYQPGSADVSVVPVEWILLTLMKSMRSAVITRGREGLRRRGRTVGAPERERSRAAKGRSRGLQHNEHHERNTTRLLDLRRHGLGQSHPTNKKSNRIRGGQKS